MIELALGLGAASVRGTDKGTSACLGISLFVTSSRLQCGSFYYHDPVIVGWTGRTSLLGACYSWMNPFLRLFPPAGLWSGILGGATLLLHDHSNAATWTRVYKAVLNERIHEASECSNAGVREDRKL